jgi:hypothetical protein
MKTRLLLYDLLFKALIPKSFLTIIVVLFTLNSGFSQSWLVNSNQWAATDALGRTLPLTHEVGAEKNGKVVGMFYWDWHQAHQGDKEPINLTELLAQYDEATVQIMMDDFNHPNWQNISLFYWEEPLFGYYRTTDEWLLRKHAEMLADAGVDVVFFDNTNGTFTWKESYTKILEVWSQARLDGVKTPQIAFLLPFGANEIANTQIIELWNDLYKLGDYQDLWFMWDGKPLIMAYPESIVPSPGTTAGLRFTATAPFNAVNATCPSWDNNIGNLTFKLYAWNNSYSESVNGTALAEKTFVNFNDNEKIQLNFDELPAGNYIWELSEGTEMVGVWKWTDSEKTVISYFNGDQVSGAYESEISYTSGTNFTTLSTGTTHVPVEIEEQALNQTEVNTIKDFFTFRPGQPGYTQGPTQNDHWGWSEVYPQHGFPLNSQGGFEQVPVSIAQNASPHSTGKCTSFNGPDTFGRNYTAGANGSLGTWDNSPDSYLKGANFQQQWDRAFELDPEMVWVTGWNEWIFGRYENWPGCSGGAQVETSFPDAFDKNRSRDIEPVKSWGNKGDVYYIQLVDNIRKFKGMQAQETASVTKTIDMINMDSWSGVTPEYKSYKGNTLHRNHAGSGSNLTYTNTSGRNDIVGAKVARDEAYVYFYVETDNLLSDKSDSNWMRLFIDIDRNKSTGWEGYDYIINRNSPTTTALVEKSTDSWAWETVGNAEYTINEKSLVLKIPYSALGQSTDDRLDFEFKWSDNMQEDGNIMDFYVNGDVAPGGRFNYVYTVAVTDDGYRYGVTPQGINQGLKCERFDGSLDQTPQFNTLTLSEVYFVEQVEIPQTSSTDFALKHTGFIEAPTKDSYTFSLEADLEAKLYIGGVLVVASNKMTGEQSGTIKLMPGKHDFKIEYITGEDNLHVLNVQMQSTTINKGIIETSLLSKYNVSPEITLSSIAEQNYFSEIDEILTASGSDVDGSVVSIELFDNQNSIAKSSNAEYILKALNPGQYNVSANVTDNDGAIGESNALNFEVKPSYAVPGTINVENFRKGTSVTITDSDDFDGGYNIRAVYGSVDYPIDVPEIGQYELTFRVPSSSGSIPTSIMIDGEEVKTLDIGNTGNDKDWYDISVEMTLNEGVQILGLSFEARSATVHKIHITAAQVMGLESNSKNSITVSPNPSSGEFLINTSEPVTSIIVYDLFGKIVEQSTERNDQFVTRIGATIKPGIYILKVVGMDGSKQIFKIIKQ